jgi:hypothetical protein
MDDVHAGLVTLTMHGETCMLLVCADRSIWLYRLIYDSQLWLFLTVQNLSAEGKSLKWQSCSSLLDQIRQQQWLLGRGSGISFLLVLTHVGLAGAAQACSIQAQVGSDTHTMGRAYIAVQLASAYTIMQFYQHPHPHCPQQQQQQRQRQHKVHMVQNQPQYKFFLEQPHACH